MPVRPDTNIHNDSTFIRTVEAAQTVAKYRLLKDGDADKECQHSGAGEAGIGISIALGGNPTVTEGAAGDEITVAALAGGQTLPVTVGTGDATRGAFAKAVADGLTDASPVAAGSTLVFVAGVFTQSGSAGDVVGLIPMPHYITET